MSRAYKSILGVFIVLGMVLYALQVFATTTLWSYNSGGRNVYWKNGTSSNLHLTPLIAYPYVSHGHPISGQPSTNYEFQFTNAGNVGSMTMYGYVTSAYNNVTSYIRLYQNGSLIATSDATPLLYNGGVETLHTWNFTGTIPVNNSDWYSVWIYTPSTPTVSFFWYYFSLYHGSPVVYYDIPRIWIYAQPANSITWDSPIGSVYDVSNTFTASLHFDLVNGGSYFERITWDRRDWNTPTSTYPQAEGFWDLYGASYAQGGTYYVNNYLITDIANGYYNNFKLYLLDSSQNVYASTTPSYYTEFFEESATGNPPQGSYGAFQFYTSSSTSYYASHLPSLFTDNGITTSTGLYTGITGFVDKLLNPIYGVSQTWQKFFNSADALSTGAQVRSGIVTIWSWFKSIDNFLGGYPYSLTILIFLFAEFAIIVIKILRVILFR